MRKNKYIIVCFAPIFMGLLLECNMQPEVERLEIISLSFLADTTWPITSQSIIGYPDTKRIVIVDKTKLVQFQVAIGKLKIQGKRTPSDIRVLANYSMTNGQTHQIMIDWNKKIIVLDGLLVENTNELMNFLSNYWLE